MPSITQHTLPSEPPLGAPCRAADSPWLAPVLQHFHVMIEDLFPTKSLYATLAVFFDFPDDPLHPRLIARVAGIDIKCVRRQLPRLVRCGVIASRYAGKERRYWLRLDFPLHGELVSIFGKTRDTRIYRGQNPFPDPLGFLEDLLDDGE